MQIMEKVLTLLNEGDRMGAVKKIISFEGNIYGLQQDFTGDS